MSNIDGSFMLCSATLQNPSVLIIAALDASGNAYPPFITSISSAVNLGTIQLGGCHVKCGLDDQQQSSAASVISGVITTGLIAETGSTLPRYAIEALDGSRNIWDLVMPNFNTAQASMFTTTANGCAGQASFCAPYTFAMPSQKPVVSTQSGYLQQAGAPVYSMYASVNGAASCVPSLVLTNFQADGVSPLIASPGSRLMAATLVFQACH